MRILTVLILFAFGPILLKSQTVETVATNPKLIDGIVSDAAGNIYTTPGAFNNEPGVGRATPDGDYDPFFYTGFNGAADIDLYSDGNFFVTNYDDKTLKRYDPILDEITNLATNLDGPAGVLLDEAGNVFVSCYGAPSSFDGNQIMKIHTNGTIEIWLEDNTLFRPQGMTFDDDGNLWVANTASGEIFKIDTTTRIPELMYELGPQAGDMTFRHKDQHIYFAAQGQNKIYKLDLEGNATVFAGTGGGGTIDGGVLEAEFKTPFGVCFTPSEDTLYVSGGGDLRRIVGFEPITTSTQDIKETKLDLLAFPNPGQGELRLQWSKEIFPQSARLLITSIDGAVIQDRVVSLSGLTFELSIERKGVFFLKLFAREGVLSGRVIIQ